jgi:Mrp family chromosome partitioning ATPase/capsular polysaccharide biosynthesis protein
MHVLKRRAWLVALMVAFAVAAALVVSASESATYRASMKIVVGQGNGFFQPQFGSSVQPFAQTMTNLLESDIVASTAIQSLHSRLTPKELLGNLSVTSNPESSVLQVSYDAASPRQAVTILNQVGQTFTILVRQKLNNGHPTAAGSSPITASVFDPAHALSGTVSPRPVRNALIAGALGLILGIAAAFLRESTGERIRSREQAESWYRAQLVGSIPKATRRFFSRSGAADQRALQEALHMLRANLEFANGGHAGPCLAVTSAIESEGKTTLAANLATMLALAGNRTICVDGDLRKPDLATYLGYECEGAGLSDVLEGKAKLADALFDVSLSWLTIGGRVIPRQMWPAAGVARESRSGGGSLQLLAQGSPHPDPANLFQPGAITKLFKDLSALADYVIFDTPPLLLAADAVSVVHASNSVIIVARADYTPRGAAEAAAATLDDLGVARRLVVLNGSSRSDSYGAYGRYGLDAAVVSVDSDQGTAAIVP